LSKTIDLNKMSSLLASKEAVVKPAEDAKQRGHSGKEPQDETVNLSFKVPAQVRKRFKLAAIHAGITQNELVQRMLAAWEAQHPER
jgi:predicted HicB family RNase H-like nuclease